MNFTPAEQQTISQLVAQIGETDQQFLNAPTVELAIQRAKLRVALSSFSHQKTEKSYFLTEAAALLELALMDCENVAQQTALSSTLADVYLAFFQHTHETRYLTIVNQILKPLSHINQLDILLGLARVSAAQHHTALSKHWLTRLLKLDHVQANDILHYPEFAALSQETWFVQLLNIKLN